MTINPYLQKHTTKNTSLSIYFTAGVFWCSLVRNTLGGEKIAIFVCQDQTKSDFQ